MGLPGKATAGGYKVALGSPQKERTTIMAKARHRKPSKTAQGVQRAAVVTTGAALATGSTLVFPSDAFAQDASAWNSIIECESSGQNVQNSSTSASGYFQIMDGTWAGAGGVDKYGVTSAIDASFEAQADIAFQIASARGSLADWNASRACWGDEISSDVPSGPALPAFSAPAPEPVEAPVAPPVEVTPEPVPAPAPVEEVTTPGATYTVVKGDSLIQIGAKVGKSWEELAALNGLDNPWMIFPDQVLRIEEDKVEYVVVEGDTLSEIAPELGTTTEKLYEENVDVIGPNPDLIFPGQVYYVGGLLLPQAPVTIEEEAKEEEVVPVAEAGAEIVEKDAPAAPELAEAPVANSAGPLSANARLAVNTVYTNVPGTQLITLGGTRSSARDPHGHPSGNAVDYMVLSDASLGDAIAQYNIDNWDLLGVEYIIWQQRILTSPGAAWEYMEDRGSITQNHYDHVHVNYR